MNAWKTVLTILCATAITAVAQVPEHDGAADTARVRPDRMHRGMELSRLLADEAAVKKLGLTAEQVAAVHERAAETQEKIVMLRSSVELAERNLRQLMHADTLNRDDILKAADAANEASAKLRTAMIEEQLAFADIVGPETLRKARRMMQKQTQKPEEEKVPRKKRTPKAPPNTGK